MAPPSKSISKGEPALPPVRLSMRHFKPRPTKPGLGRPAARIAAARPRGGGGRT